MRRVDCMLVVCRGEDDSREFPLRDSVGPKPKQRPRSGRMSYDFDAGIPAPNEKFYVRETWLVWRDLEFIPLYMSLYLALNLAYCCIWVAFIY